MTKIQADGLFTKIKLNDGRIIMLGDASFDDIHNLYVTDSEGNNYKVFIDNLYMFPNSKAKDTLYFVDTTKEMFCVKVIVEELMLTYLVEYDKSVESFTLSIRNESTGVVYAIMYLKEGIMFRCLETDAKSFRLTGPRSIESYTLKD